MMKNVCENVKGNLKLYSMLVGAILLVVTIPPFIMAVGVTCGKIFGFAAGESNAWIGFWGSYLGGLISGIITLAGVYYGFILQENKNAEREERKKILLIYSNFYKIRTMFDFLYEMTMWIDAKYEWDFKYIRDRLRKMQDYNEVMVGIDIDWHIELSNLLNDTNQIIHDIHSVGDDLTRYKEIFGDKKEYKKRLENMQNKMLPYLQYTPST